MIECKTESEIITFDGHVIGRYRYSGASEHYHIDFLESVEVTTDKKGRQHLRFTFKQIGGYTRMPDPSLTLESSQHAQVFVGEVMRVKASRQG